MLSLTTFAVSFNLFKIHLSAIVNLLLSIASESTSEIFIKVNREAFHILFAKFRPYSKRSSLILISCPPYVFKDVNVNLSASEPYLSII